MFYIKKKGKQNVIKRLNTNIHIIGKHPFLKFHGNNHDKSFDYYDKGLSNSSFKNINRQIARRLLHPAARNTLISLMYHQYLIQTKVLLK